MTKRLVIILILLSVCGFSLFAQDSFEEWKKQQDQAFSDYLDAEDREFAEFLKTEWEQFEAFKANTWDPEPKPVQAPSVTPGYTKESVDRAGKYFERQIAVPAKPAADAGADQFANRFQRPSSSKLQVPFYDGNDLYLYNPGVPDMRISAPVSNQKFSDAWVKLNGWDYEQLVADCLAVKEEAKLNDWAYYKLIAGVGESLYPRDGLSADVLSWFLLVKSGFDSKAAYSVDGRRIYVLLPSNNMIYDVVYFYFNAAGPYYYFFSEGAAARNVQSFYTYTSDNPGSSGSIDMYIAEVPSFTKDLSSRSLKFNYRGEAYSVDVKIDKNLISVGNGYPQTDLEVYFTTPVSPVTRHSLVGGLQILVGGLSETEAVNMLLRFVQTAFEYQTDQQQFGIEKPLFVEESLFYPYCDCEDRSVLFSYLVEEIVGLEVIGLDYPGHIATAVKFSKPVSGDSITYRGQRYVICDPTYINADIGMGMPSYASTRPEVIEINR